MTEAVRQQRSWYKRPIVWVLAAIVLGLGAFGIRQTLSRPPRITYGEFLTQLDVNNIAAVTFSGTQVDGTLKRPLGQASENSAGAANSFRSQVPDFGDSMLLPELRQAHIPIAVTSSSAYWWGTSAVVGGLAAILLAKPMLLIIAGAFIAGLVRVARGGKMDIKSTLAMVPMFKSFADQTGDHKDIAGSVSPQLNRPLPVEDEMAHAPEIHAKRAWYLSPVLWGGVIVIAALAVFSLVEMNKAPVAISYGDFLDQLDAGNVVSVTIAATQIDGTFKQPVKVLTAKNGESQTTFRSQAPSFGDPALLPELRQQHVAIDVVSSSGWLSWLARLPWPMVLIIVGLLIAGLVKLLRGDKTASGLDASSHPLTGMITGLFGRPSQPQPPSIGDRNASPKV